MGEQSAPATHQSPVSPDSRLRNLGLLIFVGWVALAGGLVVAGIAFGHAMEMSRDMGMGMSDAAGLVAALPGMGAACSA